MATVLEHYGLRVVADYKSESLETDIPSDEIIGIEVEVENVRRVGDGLSSVWQITEDGSLRNAGREFITFPIKAKYATHALDNLMNEGLSKDCSFSPRTSVHIHLNVQDLETAQVVDLTMLYTLFEEHLFRFVGRNRIRNPYCVPITQTNLLSGLVRRGLSTRWEKYAGFNLLPLLDKGTVEFRHMHGSPDVTKLSNWISLIVGMKEWIKKHSSASIRKRFHAITHDDVPSLAQEIWPKHCHLLKWEKAEEFYTSMLFVKYLLANRTTLTSLANQVSNTSTYFQIK